MVSMRKLKREIKTNKEGILGGGVVGFVSWLIASNQGKLAQAQSAAMQTQGMLDTTLSASPETLASVKVMLLMVITGMGVGFLIDNMVNPKR